MLVGFTTTYMCMQSVPITTNVVSSNPAQARCTRYSITFFQWLAKGRKFSSGTPSSSTNKTDRHDIVEILLKVALNTINQPTNQNLITKTWYTIISISEATYSLRQNITSCYILCSRRYNIASVSELFYYTSKHSLVNPKIYKIS